MLTLSGNYIQALCLYTYGEASGGNFSRYIRHQVAALALVRALMISIPQSGLRPALQKDKSYHWMP